MKFYLKLLTSAGTLSTGWLGRNYYNQYKALENPDQVNPHGRLGAMLASRNFDHNQVGYGVYPSIRLIHLLFGNIGEQEIGRLFNSPEGQALMKELRTIENHKKLGTIEQKYWISEKGQGKNISDELMICFGAVADPDFRAYVQESNAKIREFLS